MELWNDVVPYLYIAIYLAVGVLFLVRFKSSAAGLLGGFAGALWVLIAVAWRVLFFMDEPWQYEYFELINVGLGVANLFGWVLVFVAIATIPLSRGGRDTLGGPDLSRPRPAPDSRPLAGRGARFGAAMIDAVAGLIFQAPGLVLLIMAEGEFDSDEGMLALVAMLAGATLIMIPRAILLGVRGQTIGKLVVGVKIVRHPDQAPAGFARAFLLRMFLNGLIASIPCLGSVYVLVDIFFIFRQDRRCLHDFIAGTIVVDAR